MFYKKGELNDEAGNEEDEDQIMSAIEVDDDDGESDENSNIILK